MAKEFYLGAIVLVPKNFNIKEHRNCFAKVVYIHGDHLTLQFMGGKEVEATIEDVSARRMLSIKDRWEVLNRDRFVCRLCGRGAGAIPGLALHVDHAKSFHDGGTTEDLDNLWTLCSECNAGKGSASMEKINSGPLLSETELNETREMIRSMIEANEKGLPRDETQLTILIYRTLKMIDEMQNR